MSYKVYQLDALDPIQWSQASWRIEGPGAAYDCDQELIHDVLLRHLPRDGIIVEAGCGNAKWASYLRGLGYHMVGIDISREATAVARQSDAALALTVADTRRAPVRDHSVDAVMSLGVVEHEEGGPLPALRELHRILKPNGLLILEVPYNSILRRVLTNRLHDFVTWRRRRATWRLGFMEYRFSKREVRQFLERSRFTVVSAHPNDYQPPRNMGLWVDYHNIVFDPFFPPTAKELFVLPGVTGKIGAALVRWVPWLACGTVTFVARAR